MENGDFLSGCGVVRRERLKELRVKRGFQTQKAFVAHANKYFYPLDVQRYGAIERGVARVGLDEIWMICKAMEVTADEWVFDVEKDRRKPYYDLLSGEERAFIDDVILSMIKRFK
jgi:transcriptional regulator with XRE-family HTH domain